MVNINLMPWRDKRRELKRKEFLQVCLLILIGVGGTLFLVSGYYDAKISAQKQRNDRVQVEISALLGQVQEINELRKQKEAMISRMGVIQSLQGDRPMIVNIFDQLARTLPQGVFYRSVNRQGDRIQIVGIAESNARVSALVRQMDASEWFADPRPADIKAAPQFGEFATQFTLTVDITAPTDIAQEE